MTSTGSVWPVALDTSGSYTDVSNRPRRDMTPGRLTSSIINTLCFYVHPLACASPRQRKKRRPLTFSSPIVNCPCDSSLACIYAPSFLIASLWLTESAKATLDFVYSWPGCSAS